MRGFLSVVACAVFLGGASSDARGDGLPGEGPRLGGHSITQQDIESGALSLREIRLNGRRIFSTPFNKFDGYGDGPMNPNDPTTPGGRPTLQGNGTFLRVNGLDGQSCLECHSILSNASIPAKFGVGGVGGSVSNAMFLPTVMDVNDSADEGIATFNGRFINPPFLFGSGGVELLGKEMTTDLQALKQTARDHPGIDVDLVTKGVNFGVIRFDSGQFDTSRVAGIDSDLVVRPFGRKGEFATTRGFDAGALQFHFGMQAVEVVGADVDADGDGVVNEILVGEVSAMVIFNTTLERPRSGRLSKRARAGAAAFRSVGCAECHVPQLTTSSATLTHSFPELATDPAANVYYEVDLTRAPAGFQRAARGGLVVPLFADLKRHEMGAELAESFGSSLDGAFTTARLWGVADTAPYMHDGRALTLREAIMMHGGEALSARDNFAALGESAQGGILAFLRTLRTPGSVGADLDE